MKISEVIKPAGVAVDVPALSKNRLLQLLSKKAAHALGVSERDILAALHGREALGSTGIGGGIAIPHAPVVGISAPFGLLVRLSKPIEFDALDDQPVDIICLILTPPESQSPYLRLLSAIARQLRSPDAVRRIRSARDSEHVYSVLADCDR